MLGNHGRSFPKLVFGRFVKFLAARGVTPNQVTVIGTLITVVLSLLFLAQGYLAIGGISLGIVLLMDSVDGMLARETGNYSDFGAFLDSSLDRISDGAVFACLIYWAAVGLPHGWVRTVSVIAGLAALVAGAAVSYVRARGECFGVIAKVGLAERTDRLIVALVCAGLTDFGLPQWLYAIGLLWVALGSTITVFQRVFFVYRELN